MEASFAGANFGPFAGMHFTPAVLREMGHGLCDSILDYFDPDQAPTPTPTPAPTAGRQGGGHQASTPQEGIRGRPSYHLMSYPRSYQPPSTLIHQNQKKRQDSSVLSLQA